MKTKTREADVATAASMANAYKRALATVRQPGVVEAKCSAGFKPCGVQVFVCCSLFDPELLETVPDSGGLVKVAAEIESAAKARRRRRFDSVKLQEAVILLKDKVGIYEGNAKISEAEGNYVQARHERACAKSMRLALRKLRSAK